MAIENQSELISMAQIAKLAGESRSTVGNWKNRQSDFPVARGGNPRGPLYDRNEVIDWLTNTGRLGPEQGADKFAWRLLEALRGNLRTDEAIELTIVLLGVKIVAQRQTPKIWTDLVSTAADQRPQLDVAVHELLPFISELYDPKLQYIGPDLEHVISLLDAFDTQAERGLALLDALIENLTKHFGKSGAEYTSPANLRQLLVGLAEPSGVVYDPGAGFGQLLVDASISASQGVQLFGQEVNRRTWELGTLNLFLRGIAADYRCGDTFGEDAFPDLLADIILAVPPFNANIPAMERLQDDPRWVFGEPGPKDGNTAWIQHCLHHLSPTGRAFMVLPQGALFESGKAGRIRQRIIKSDLLDAVISLPGGLFSHTSIPTSLLIFERSRKHADTQGKPGPTLMVDASDLGEKRGRLETAIPEDVIVQICDTYHSWRGGKQFAPDSYSALATFDDIAANEFVIDPRRYVSSSVPAVNEETLSLRKAELQMSLADAIASCNAADRKLLQSLGRSR